MPDCCLVLTSATFELAQYDSNYLLHLSLCLPLERFIKFLNSQSKEIEPVILGQAWRKLKTTLMLILIGSEFLYDPFRQASTMVIKHVFVNLESHLNLMLEQKDDSCSCLLGDISGPSCEGFDIFKKANIVQLVDTQE